MMGEAGSVRLDGWRTECWCGAVFAGDLIWHCLLCGNHPAEVHHGCPGCGASKAVVSTGGRAVPAFILVQSGQRLLRYKPLATLTEDELDLREFRELAMSYANAGWEAAMAELRVMADPDCD